MESYGYLTINNYIIIDIISYQPDHRTPALEITMITSMGNVSLHHAAARSWGQRGIRKQRWTNARRRYYVARWGTLTTDRRGTCTFKSAPLRPKN